MWKICTWEEDNIFGRRSKVKKSKVRGITLEWFALKKDLFGSGSRVIYFRGGRGDVENSFYELLSQTYPTGCRISGRVHTNHSGRVFSFALEKGSAGIIALGLNLVKGLKVGGFPR